MAKGQLAPMFRDPLPYASPLLDVLEDLRACRADEVQAMLPLLLKLVHDSGQWPKVLQVLEVVTYEGRIADNWDFAWWARGTPDYHAGVWGHLRQWILGRRWK